MGIYNEKKKKKKKLSPVTLGFNLIFVYHISKLMKGNL